MDLPGPRSQQRSRVKVVFVTANPGQIGDADCLGYIRKPFSDAAILAAAQLATTGAAPPVSELVQLRTAIG
jgi:CheY-like chemotaxis protein